MKKGTDSEKSRDLDKGTPLDKSMSLDCSVCCEKLTKRNTVECHFCDFTTCKSCAKRFLIENINTSCMNCKKPWNRDVLTQNLGKTFVAKDYKQKRERDLFETEKALLPETQPYATAKKELAEVNREILQLQKRLRELKRKKTLLQAGNTDETILKERAAKLTIKCPVGECRGFVNSSSMTCEVCDTKICKDCREPLDKANALDKDSSLDEHTCDPNTLETVKLLKKDTKNCPKCSVGIHKIEGCDQMYCTQCHTAFSWRTGEIVIGERIHNPHYYEYLRRTGGGAPRREIGDIPCGGLPTVWQMKEFSNENEIILMLRNLIHIEEVEFRNYRTDRIQNNRDLRIKYLNNEITEAAFKTTLQRREKDLEKKREILQVLNTCVVAGTDILRSLIRDKNIQKAIDSLKTLREFTNDSMKKVSKLYGCMVPIFYEYETNKFAISGRKF